MSVPKKQLAKRRARTRRSHHGIAKASLSTCSHCGAKTAPHRACSACGYYNGKPVRAAEDAPAPRKKAKASTKK